MPRLELQLTPSSISTSVMVLVVAFGKFTHMARLRPLPVPVLRDSVETVALRPVRVLASQPMSLWDTSGNVYFTDFSNHRVRKVFASNDTVITFAGTGTGTFSGDAGPATSAGIYPPGLALDSSGNMHIAEFTGNRVRKVSTNGKIITFAGNGTGTFSGDAGPATNAALNIADGVALDTSGNVYVADYSNNRVRIIYQ
jgi:hypothetical protein